MSSGENLKDQLLSIRKIKLPVVTQPSQEIQSDFSSKLHYKRVNGEQNILIGIDR